MRYLCMICYDESKLEALSQSEFDTLVEEALAYDDVLIRGGHYVASDALLFANTAATVRVVEDRIAVTDGPFAETKEQMGGFILIEAKDLNEAIRLASKIPPVRLGCVEVRPVRSFDKEKEARKEKTK